MSLSVAASNNPNARVVMVIDDVEGVRETVIDVLELEAIDALAASSGEEAIEMLQAQSGQIGLAILDIQMPGLTCRESYTGLKALQPNLPIVLSSGRATGEMMRSFGDLEPADYLSKPFTIDALLDMVRKFIPPQVDSQ